MQYDNYDLKMQRAARTVKAVIRLSIRLTILAVFMVSIAATLLATKGIVKVDDDPFPTEIVYGDELGYHASAFLSKVDYEYAKAHPYKLEEE